jgi:ParB family chromosome partitioning protein
LSRRPLRAELGDIEPLAESIGKNGLLQPIVVRLIDDGYFEIVAGNRRFLACRHLSLRKIP